MNLREAHAILDAYLPGGPVTVESVRHAFAQAARGSHPDTSKVEQGRPSLHSLKEARDKLLHHYAGKAPPCPVCRSSGVVAVGFTTNPCPRGCPAP